MAQAMTAYYNEIDPYAAAWLRNLIAAGHIADGVVDERSIVDVRPEDLAGFTQVHFFAGLGGWSHAARLAGWPDDRPLWTGSCPCQPFSVAGKGAGTADERHLWPEMHRLVAALRPPVVVGEQVASRAGLDWLDAVCADLEGAGYATGAIDLCAASVGAPHIRQRLWWVAYADSRQRHGLAGSEGRIGDRAPTGWQQGNGVFERRSADGGVADAESERQCANELGRNRSDRVIVDRSRQRGHGGDDGATGGMGDASGERLQRGSVHAPKQAERQASLLGSDGVAHSDSSTGFWSNADWIPCRDGKARPVEPGTFPLVDRAPARVGRLRAYGNAIVPQVAAEVLIATSELVANRLKPVANGGTDGV